MGCVVLMVQSANIPKIGPARVRSIAGSGVNGDHALSKTKLISSRCVEIALNEFPNKTTNEPTLQKRGGVRNSSIEFLLLSRPKFGLGTSCVITLHQTLYSPTILK